MAFFLSLSCLFSSPRPGSVTFPCASSVYPKRRIGVFALNPENHVPDPALPLTAPAAHRSWGVHLQEPNEVSSWVQESSLQMPGRC